ncbi:hypothetical protein BD626DRAFT_477996 [Schizophyllum amplum]|uniref:Uncharacterized protein n=1 Tax=Schizophyllum amplum TaxID=97359 RepID=A0A550D0P3_9AGAR|nr:hypothetical protein BD626DRAFT_477996 [Auriculariopsis ampla]
MTSRPILKACVSEQISACAPPQTPFVGALPFATYPHGMQSPHVHFPPTPNISSHHTTHSPAQYDRAPIVVGPNNCELPERGDRVCSPPNKKQRTTPPKGSYFHPRAFEAIEPESEPNSPLPPLVTDVSSSSESTDESDACASPEASSPAIASERESRLSFLPHSPGPGDQQRPGKRKHVRRPTGPIRRASSTRVSFSSFNESSEDDEASCLGGF